MFKVGSKIDFWPFYVQSSSQNRCVTILNLYMGGGRGTHRFSPLHRCLDPRLDPCLDRCLDRCASLCPSIEFFGFFGVCWNYFQHKFLWKIAFPYCIFCYRLVCAGNLAPQQQKSENQKILYSPVGEKKTTEFVPPQKESFGKSKAVYVRSRSQNRCLTILCSN